MALLGMTEIQTFALIWLPAGITVAALAGIAVESWLQRRAKRR